MCELTLVVVGEVSGGVGLISQLVHSPAAAIGTTREKEVPICYLATKDFQKLQPGSWLRITYFRVA